MAICSQSNCKFARALDLIFIFGFCSEDESEFSDTETEPLAKGEGLVNGSSNGLTLNGSLSRDGRLKTVFYSCS